MAIAEPCTAWMFMLTRVVATAAEDRIAIVQRNVGRFIVREGVAEAVVPSTQPLDGRSPPRERQICDRARG